MIDQLMEKYICLELNLLKSCFPSCSLETNYLLLSTLIIFVWICFLICIHFTSPKHRANFVIQNWIWLPVKICWMIRRGLQVFHNVRNSFYSVQSQSLHFKRRNGTSQSVTRLLVSAFSSGASSWILSPWILKHSFNQNVNAGDNTNYIYSGNSSNLYLI